MSCLAVRPESGLMANEGTCPPYHIVGLNLNRVKNLVKLYAYRVDLIQILHIKIGIKPQQIRWLYKVVVVYGLLV